MTLTLGFPSELSIKRKKIINTINYSRNEPGSPKIQFLDEKRLVTGVITGTKYGDLKYYAVYLVKVIKKIRFFGLNNILRL